jgi:hypothetical protein
MLTIERIVARGGIILAWNALLLRIRFGKLPSVFPRARFVRKYKKRHYIKPAVSNQGNRVLNAGKSSE